MVSRTLPTSLILSLAILGTACGDDGSADASSSTTFTTDTPTETGFDSNTETSAGSASGDGDGDSGDGDGDTGDGDGDPAGDGDGDTGDGDGDDPTDTEDTGDCLDLDQDGFGENCDMGPDCDDDDYYNHTVDGCANCDDADQDGWWLGCDSFDDNQQGPDCDDEDFNVFSEEGCANCVDLDMDGVWVGCDQYGDDKPGPDCDDDNQNVGLGDIAEICNGIAENCAGEVDNAPPDEMCAPLFPDAPNIAPMNGWCCNPPAPGQDGCEICECVEQFFDLDAVVQNGCECAATPRTDSLAVCSGFPQGELGSVAEGEQLNNLVLGSIPELDNGVGAGREDWYWVEFPENDANGTRPNTGSVQLDFAVNTGNDYRFQVYGSCQGVAWANGLTLNLGQDEPAREWWFYDDHTAPLQMPDPNKYQDDVDWPDLVYIRVFRVQNDNTCNDYQLRVRRLDN